MESELMINIESSSSTYFSFRNSNEIILKNKIFLHKSAIDDGYKCILHQYEKYLRNGMDYFFINLEHNEPFVKRELMKKILFEFPFVLYLDKREDIAQYKLSYVHRLSILPKLSGEDVIEPKIEEIIKKCEMSPISSPESPQKTGKTMKISPRKKKAEYNFDDVDLYNLELFYCKYDKQHSSHIKNTMMHNICEKANYFIVGLTEDFMHQMMFRDTKTHSENQDYYLVSPATKNFFGYFDIFAISLTILRLS